MKEAIQKAIEGGYKIAPFTKLDKRRNHAVMWSDPLFWQALGKAMGWEKPPANEVANIAMYKETRDWTDSFSIPWLFHWHRFIDHLAEGKDAESFFNELLK